MHFFFAIFCFLDVLTQHVLICNHMLTKLHVNLTPSPPLIPPGLFFSHNKQWFQNKFFLGLWQNGANCFFFSFWRLKEQKHCPIGQGFLTLYLRRDPLSSSPSWSSWPSWSPSSQSSSSSLICTVHTCGDVTGGFLLVFSQLWTDP